MGTGRTGEGLLAEAAYQQDPENGQMGSGREEGKSFQLGAASGTEAELGASIGPRHLLCHGPFSEVPADSHPELERKGRIGGAFGALKWPQWGPESLVVEKLGSRSAAS